MAFLLATLLFGLLDGLLPFLPLLANGLNFLCLIAFLGFLILLFGLLILLDGLLPLLPLLGLNVLLFLLLGLLG